MIDYPLRRKDREISPEECMAILQQGNFCVLASLDAEHCPYATPLSYIYLNSKIYFHSAKEGHKINNFRANSRCSVAVVGRTQPVYLKDFTTYYESVIIFGAIAEVSDSREKAAALTELARKYLPEHMDKVSQSIEKSLFRTAVYAVTIEKMTGKAKKEEK